MVEVIYQGDQAHRGRGVWKMTMANTVPVECWARFSAHYNEELTSSEPRCHEIEIDFDHICKWENRHTEKLRNLPQVNAASRWPSQEQNPRDPVSALNTCVCSLMSGSFSSGRERERTFQWAGPVFVWVLGLGEMWLAGEAVTFILTFTFSLELEGAALERGEQTVE